jgi:hypothetical protein
LIFVDAHVHIYDCFDVGFLFDSALKNFQAAAAQQAAVQPVSFVLLLTEGAAEDWFQVMLASIAQDVRESVKISAKWTGLYSEEPGSLTVFRHESPDERIHLVGGRQVVTREKIEVLALYCTKTITDGLSLDETVTAIEQCEGIPVLPWGVGKWVGKRGGIIKRYLVAHPERRLFLGDNGGRPQFWPTPALFHFARTRGVAVLPGTDPLPLAAEAARVGSYGFYLEEKMAHRDSPATYLRNTLRSQEIKFTPFGGLQSSRLFFMNQLRLRFS